jgi:hypothetical protein
MSYHRSILLVGRCGYWFGHHNLALLGEFFSTRKPFLEKNEILEVISKCQIAFESKAQADEKAQSRLRRDELILKRSATQLSDARWGFESTSKHFYLFREESCT